VPVEFTTVKKQAVDGLSINLRIVWISPVVNTADYEVLGSASDGHHYFGFFFLRLHDMSFL